jgi:hypothetical protein
LITVPMSSTALCQDPHRAGLGVDLDLADVRRWREASSADRERGFVEPGLELSSG